MKEQEKLDEAEYFYQRMIVEQNNQLYFKYNLSAFLSAARSVLQYAAKDVDPANTPSARPGAKAWYDCKITSSIILPFFRDTRDVNIHRSPVSPKSNTTLQVDDLFHAHFIDHVSLNGQAPAETPPPPAVVREKELKPPPPPPEYKFTDWSGTEDVPTLCRKYLGELEQFIKEGVSLGYISG
ncbi:MAG: hypothetical protein NTX30_23380 [Deltaproteobacteria bacterium]|nr:hypothetical protein [Deltaproteobacteria bacterium]